ncbi:MAG: TetR/AcrR family transcriptional regulator [Gammaproteobacteria bacterium]|nr:TetR/AcrR family transcriptional regulator [Gammaproteobacteria bacterium]
MAQRSKKDHIVATALPLFLENGFKGTSIDMVVKASKVSKPTVYNHFPDKSALIHEVMLQWIDNNKPLIVPIRDQLALDELVRTRWLTDEAINFYAMVIGEGWRFPEGKQVFWEQFDRLWRKALGYVSSHSESLQRINADLYLDQQLLNRLRAR